MNNVVRQASLPLVEIFPTASPVLRHGRHSLKTGRPAELTQREFYSYAKSKELRPK